MKMKKFTAVILALVMIFAMSANAFAAGNSTTSVEIQMYGEEAYTVSVTDQDISSLCGNASHLYITGFPVDCVHAAATWLFLWFGAEPMLEKLDRIKVKYGLIT